MDYTAVGDTTNLAARLLDIAQPGPDRRQPTARARLTEGFFAFDDLGEFTLKGKSEPVPALGGHGEIRGRTRLEVSRERGLTPLVGRDPELSRSRGPLPRGAREGAARPRPRRRARRRASPACSTSSCTGSRRPGLSSWRRPACRTGARCRITRSSSSLRRYLELTDGMTDDDIRAARRPVVSQALGLERRGASGPARALPRRCRARRVPDAARRRAAQGADPRAMLRAFCSASRGGGRVVAGRREPPLGRRQLARSSCSTLPPRLPGHRVLLLLSARPGLAAAVARAAACGDRDARGPGTGDVRGDDRGPARRRRRCPRRSSRPSSTQERGQPALRRGDRSASSGRRAASSSRTAKPRAQRGRVRGARDHPRPHRRAHRPARRPAEADAAGGRGGRARVRHSLSVAAPRDVDEPRRPGTSPSSGARLRLPGPDPSPSYSFKHALTQEVVYGGLLERRRRLYHARVGAALEELVRRPRSTTWWSCSPTTTGGAPRTRRRSTTPSWPPRRPSGGGPTWRRSPTSTRAQASGGHGGHESNRLRRIDAVVKQAGDQVRPRASRRARPGAGGDPRPRRGHLPTPPRRAAWYCWTGFLHSLTGARPESPRVLPEASAIADAAGLDEIRAFADCCLTHVYVVAGRLREALEAGERALAPSRRADNVWWACRTLLGPQPGGQRRSGIGRASLDYCRRAPRAWDGRERPPPEGCRAGGARAPPTSSRATPGTAYVLRRGPALSPIPFDAAMVKACAATASSRAGEVAVGIAELTEAVAWFDRSQLPVHRARSSAAGWPRPTCARRDGTGARTFVEGIAGASRELGYRHLEGVAERLLGEAVSAATRPRPPNT